MLASFRRDVVNLTLTNVYRNYADIFLNELIYIISI